MPYVESLQIALIVSFVLLCLRLAVGASAFAAFVAFWRDAPRRRPLRGCMIWFFVVFAIDALQTTHDASLTTRLGVDYSAVIHAFEGDLVARTQQALAWPPLTALLAFCYVIGFVGLLLGLAHAYDRAGDFRRLRMVVFAYAANYLLVFPFYLFLPVREPWAHPGSGVLPLTDLHLGEWVMALIRPMSGIDNCMPSYHTSLTFSLMLTALDGRRDALTWFAVICGSLVIASTIVLGFHWVSDVAAGLVAGYFVHRLARRYAARRADPSPVVQLRGATAPQA
jgi:membrane-associated phospholipid phosphatase